MCTPKLWQEFVARSQRAVRMALLIALAAGCSRVTTSGDPGAHIGAVTVDGARLAYTVEGRGHPCLVVGSRLHHSRVFSPRFKSELRCAYADTRMFTPGAQPPPGSAYDLAAMVRDLEAVRRDLGWDSVVVVGHSLFAWVALEYAQAHPERTRGVVMVAMSPTLPSAARLAEFMEQDASPQRKAAHARQQEGWAQWLRERERSPDEQFMQFGLMHSAIYWYDSEFDSRPLWKGVFWDAELFNQVLASGGQNYDLAARPVVEVPVFVALGRYDYRIPYALWDERSSAVLPRLSFHIFPRSGHWPQFEEADAFDEAVIRWLRSDVVDR